MKKQILAVMLTGTMVFGCSLSAFAAEAESLPAEAPAAEEAGSLEDVLSAIVGEGGGSVEDLVKSIVGENGENVEGVVKSIVGENGENVQELVESIVGENGENVRELVNSFVGENGEGLEEILGKFGLGDVISSDGQVDVSGLLEKFGINNVSEEDVSSLIALFQDPDAFKEMLTGLFTKDGIGTLFLNMASAKSPVLGKITESLKAEDGGYDVEKVMTAFGSIEEKDGTVVINGTEIPEEELTAAVEDTMNEIEQLVESEVDSQAEAVAQSDAA